MIRKVSPFWVLSLLITGTCCCVSVPQSQAENSDGEIHQDAYSSKLINSQLPDVTKLSPNQESPSDEYNRRLKRLLYLLKPQKQPIAQSDSDQELQLHVRPVKPLLPVSPVQPVAQFKPIGYFKTNIGYFQTSNIFSASDRPIQDSLAFAGLTLGSVNFPLGYKTYGNVSIDGNLIRYINQSKYDYNQVVFNASVYRELSRQMYGGIKWSNQQLFYTNSSDYFKSGDRFLNETSVKLSLSRRDPLTKKLMLDSLDEFGVNFADPGSRSRFVNYFLLSLNYYLQKPLQVGLDYELNWADFTQQNREDLYHRIFSHLNYSLSNTSSINLQAGVSTGGSNVSSIDYSGWFFTINYNLLIGRF